MDIKEAVKEAVEIGGFIERKAFGNENAFRKYKIKPTNSRATCVTYVLDKNGKTAKHCKDWNPTADDLTADDWEALLPNAPTLINDNKGFSMAFEDENKSIRKRTKNIEKIHLKIHGASGTEKEARRTAKKISEMIQRENHLAKDKMSYEIKIDFT